MALSYLLDTSGNLSDQNPILQAKHTEEYLGDALSTIAIAELEYGLFLKNSKDSGTRIGIFSKTALSLTLEARQNSGRFRPLDPSPKPTH